MQNIFLIGFMGSGKTAIGKRLAPVLGMQFLDMDAYIEEKQQKKISELFAENGEAGFREIEQKALHEMATYNNVVISTGGGAPCYFNNIDVMNAAGTTIYLKANPKMLAEQLDLCKQNRPLIKNKSLEELRVYVAQTLAEREKWYNQAQLTYPLTVTKSKEELLLVAEDLARTIGRR
ncbi:shikimate kinase [Bacteroidia bacterium]|nr:shikimate kinase [Bacteroidia bacterium]